MPKHEKTSCPRCHKDFECKMGSILLCHCSDVRLTESQQEFTAEHWEGCLCHDCLVEISNMERVDDLPL